MNLLDDQSEYHLNKSNFDIGINISYVNEDSDFLINMHDNFQKYFQITFDEVHLYYTDKGIEKINYTSH
jgi:hypothetical protein